VHASGHAIPAFTLTKIIGKHLESLTIMGRALIIANRMWVIDAMNSKSEAAAPARRGRIRVWHMKIVAGTGGLDRRVPDSSAVFPERLARCPRSPGQLSNVRASALEFLFSSPFHDAVPRVTTY